MAETYRIIQNEETLDRFLSLLPETTQNEKYYISLFARKKYWPEIKADKGQLKRVLSNKKHIKEKLFQLECKIGAYRFEGKSIPQEALAVYIMPNPRCVLSATRGSLVKFAELIAKGHKGYNPYQEVLSQLQTHRSRSVFIDFDYDQPEKPDLNGVINPEAVHYVRTRGGWHALVETDKVKPEFKKTFYLKMSRGADVMGDNLLPIPGCCQGGFTVELYE